jgi:predicted helicase
MYTFKKGFEIYNNNIKTFEITKDKGDAFESMCLELLLADKVNLDIDKKRCWLYKDVPENLKAQLRLQKGDTGIDIIAYSKKPNCLASTFLCKKEKLYFIQCKWRADIAKKLPYRELSTFMSHVGNNPYVHKGILMSTAPTCEEMKNYSDKYIIYEYLQIRNMWK